MSGIVMGIDPGKSGGLAVREELSGHIQFIAMPNTRRRLFDWLKEVTDPFLSRRVYIEEVSGYQGVEHPGSRMFHFGQQYERVLCALEWLNITPIMVQPKEWQKVFGLKRIKSWDDRQWKNHLKAKAQQLFPKLIVTLETADALLIMQYGILQSEMR